MTTNTIPPTDTPISNEVPDPPIERWLSSPDDIVTINAWRDPLVESMPGIIPTASDEALVTGRVDSFVRCQCFSGGVL